ncbi:MAG TPA: SRPBCC family protein [Ktedonobacteraceae bacterium]|nr:SRPBCC family protein [Ktedonobacteraceae bacterium]
MIIFDLEETIQRPVEVVWSFLDNTGNERQWQPATLDQRYTSPEPYGVGSVGLNARQVMGRRVETTWEITEYTPERSFTSKSTSGPISYTVSYTLEAVDSGTYLSLHFQGDPKGLFKVAEPLLASTVKKEFVEDHARLKVLLESQAS